MKKNYYIIIFLALTCLFLASLNFAQAYSFSDIGGFSKTTAGEAGLTQTDYAIIVASVITAVLALTGAIFVILFIYGGFTWLTSAGSEDKVKKAKNVLTYAVIGVFIVAAAYSITNFIATGIFTGPAVTPPNTNTTVGSQCQAAGGVCATFDNCLRTLQGSSLGIQDCGTQICCSATQANQRQDCSSCSGLSCSKSDCETIGPNCHWHALPYPYCSYDPNYNIQSNYENTDGSCVISYCKANCSPGESLKSNSCPNNMDCCVPSQ